MSEPTNREHTHSLAAACAEQVITFQIAERRYGLPLFEVIEISRVVEIVPLQRAPAVVEGVINFRGQIVPVFDLRARFSLPRRAVRLSDQLLMARTCERIVALRVDLTLELLTLSSSLLDAAHKLALNTHYAAGTLALPDGVLLLCDLASFLSEAESMALDAALSALNEPGTS